MDKFKIGDLVNAKLGNRMMVGTVIYLDKKHAQYLIRFGAAQQLYYKEDQLTPYERK
ncbi:hypothetical protein PQ472_00780 [Lacticaseibacillus pabuli]|uniref:Uncharacterized protein n=1 Tax=Lacticaseibacillus pabuli TaxID=3025672 RepID=A0ABY7WTM0_9LACO|nr:hypothetical protein [Lacticaseibacillus sp. KACC 23028]WDF82808.1 hypothetical protein PQ472_00780 [Lacticaseibacillus sp. KACC 23028]